MPDIDEINTGAADGFADNSQEPVDNGIFVPPSQGVDPIKEALRANPTNVALNIVIGDFRKGMELLKNQLGVENFVPLK